MWLAGEMIGRGEGLLELMRGFTAEINMSYLFDPVRSLFSIGYNLTAKQFDDLIMTCLPANPAWGATYR